MNVNSETSGVRYLLAKYCIGDGVDVGFGGDPIVPTAICMDMPRPYTQVGDAPQHLHGTAEDLPFQSGRLDYVYSSHLIEDFTYGAQVVILYQWVRVIKKGGLIIICAPDERRFREHCRKTGQTVNLAHVNEDYSLGNFKERVLSESVDFNFNVLMERDNVGHNGYSWCIVLEKK